MRVVYLIVSLVYLLTQPAYASSIPSNLSLNPDRLMQILSKEPEAEHNTVVKSLSNEGQGLVLTPKRSLDYPTQIIRISGIIENKPVTCEDVNNTIDELFLSKITADKFSYSTYISCSYNPNTHYATQFSINSYFDPLTDEAVGILASYLNDYNGADVYGTKLTIEPARALIVSLNISAGTKKNPLTPPLVEFREDHNSLYFKSNYEMKSQLLEDMNQHFFSNNPDSVLPFLDKWLFNYAGIVYKDVLRDANFVLLQPDRIFLMSEGEEVFVPKIRYFFTHNCSVYENHRCLQRES